MSPFMTEGTIRRWAKKEGETFLAGDILFEIESDHITIDVEAQIPGTIGKILTPEGSTNVPVEQVIALVAKTPQELARMQASARVEAPSPPTPLLPAIQQQKCHPNLHIRGAAGLEYAKSPMMASVHRSAPVFETHDTVAATVRGIVMDHTGLQYYSSPTPTPSPQDDEQATALRRTIVSTLSRRGSGAKSPDSKKCTTTQYFDGIL
ncbi:single hybrid motif-containing protein [Mycena galericulata]|nr:single hybrid motif-containing protein [Mycena galericulata]